MQINFANDLGYGSIKGYLNGHRFKMPSIISPVSKGNEVDPIDFQHKGKAFEDDYMDNYLDHMDMSVQTSNYSSGRNLIGRNVYNGTVQPTTFDVNGISRKSDSHLSIVLTLSIIAGKALKTYYNKNKALPTQDINTTVNMVTALPIMEGKRNKTLDNYADRYKNHKFTVSVFNLSDKPITINVNFSYVLVKLEGQVAVYNIKYATPSLKAHILNDFNDNYKMTLKDANMLTNVPDTLSIDIGEGTTDIATFSNNKLNTMASTSIHNGYGKVLQNAVPEAQLHQVNIGSRAELKGLLSQKTDLFNKDRKETCERAVKDNIEPLVKQITEAMSTSLDTAKNTKMVYVYGGGAIPLVKYLRKPLMDKSKIFNSGHHMVIIFIDKAHAQYMNVDGLELILNAILKLQQK